MRSEGAYSTHHYTKAFGSWDEAMAKAGIDKQAQLLAEIERVGNELGKRPSTTEMNEHGRVSSTTIIKYFENWSAACEQAEFVTSDSATEGDSLEGGGDAPQTDLDAQSSGNTGDEPVHATRGDIPENSRLTAPYIARIAYRVTDPGSAKDAKLWVTDVNGDSCWLNIWSRHRIDAEFVDGHWYQLGELQGDIFERDGEDERRLGSTRDMRVQDLGTELDRSLVHFETGTKDTTNEGGQDETEPPTDESDEDDILGEIMGEFELSSYGIRSSWFGTSTQ
jgi:hypothetical protein